MRIDRNDRSSLIPTDAGHRVRAYGKVLKRVFEDTSKVSAWTINKDAPQWENPIQLIKFYENFFSIMRYKLFNIT